MKSVVAPIVFAALLALAGTAFWMAGHTEQRLAEMHQQLAVLQYADAMNEGEDADVSLGMARRLPRVGEALANDARDERAFAQYWRSDYSAVAPKRDSSGMITETDPRLLLVGANAEFRASQHAGDRAETLRMLDRVVKTYGDLLRTDASPDVSYNYEYAVRLRENLARAKSAPLKGGDTRIAAKTSAEAASDLPIGPTLHGYPGGPPKGTDMSQFKIVIPKRGEERKDNPEAGKGGAKVRKG